MQTTNSQDLPQPNGFAIAAAGPDQGVVTIAVVGEVDMLTAPRVAQAVREAQAGSSVLLDLIAVDFLGSVGLSLLVDAARRAAEADRRFAIVARGHAVLRAIQVTGLDSVLHIFASTTPALVFLRE